MSGTGNATAPPLRTRSRRALELLLAGAALAVSLLLCVPAFRLLSAVWSHSQFYGHGYAIPAVAAFLAYRNRREVRAALRDLRPPPLGPLIALGMASIEVLMLIGEVGFGASLGIPAVLAAWAYSVGGRPLLRPLALPLGFLVLMVPPPHFLTDEILFRLKLFVTQAAVHLLQLGGQTVAADGNRVLVPGHMLFVADACSGLISIVTLLPLACIVAYFLTHGVWRRAVVVASVVPLAVGANILRVILTVHLAASGRIEFAQGLLHESFGLATYIAGTLTLLLVAKVLR